MRARSGIRRDRAPPRGAGFGGIHFEDVHEPVFYGRDLDAALAFVLGFQDTRDALASVSDDEADQAVGRLRAARRAPQRRARRGPRRTLVADHGAANRLRPAAVSAASALASATGEVLLRAPADDRPCLDPDSSVMTNLQGSLSTDCTPAATG